MLSNATLFCVFSNTTLLSAFASPQPVKLYIENSTVASNFGLGGKKVYWCEFLKQTAMEAQ